MAEDHMRYDILAQEALRGVVRKVLAEVSRTGLPGEHHFFISFATRAPGVRISEELLKQYDKMFQLENIRVTFEPQAVRAIARRAIERGTGARGLRAVLETIMRDVMFDLPSREDVREIVVTEESVTAGRPPLLVLHPENRKKEA